MQGVPLRKTRSSNVTSLSTLYTRNFFLTHPPLNFYKVKNKVIMEEGTTEKLFFWHMLLFLVKQHGSIPNARDKCLSGNKNSLPMRHNMECIATEKIPITVSGIQN